MSHGRLIHLRWLMSTRYSIFIPYLLMPTVMPVASFFNSDTYIRKLPKKKSVALHSRAGCELKESTVTPWKFLIGLIMWIRVLIRFLRINNCTNGKKRRILLFHAYFDS